MSKPRLYIHIGTHKTGTTAIQHFLSQSRQSLREQNIYCLPPLTEIRALKTCETFDQSLIDKCKQELHSVAQPLSQISKDKIFVMSYEGFSGNPLIGYKNAPIIAAQLRQITEEFDVRIICYFRRQDEFVESMYTQLIHIGKSLDFSSFIKSLPADSYNWFSLSEGYIKFFGAGNVIVRRYCRSILPERDRLLREFCSLLELELDELDFTVKKTGQNRGYSRDGLEIARLTNPILNREEKDKLHQLLHQTNSKQPFESYSYFGDTERELFSQKYAISNSELAKAQFNEESGILFPKTENAPQIKYQGLTAETLTPFLVKAILSEKSVEKSFILRGIAKLESKLLGLFNKV